MVLVTLIEGHVPLLPIRFYRRRLSIHQERKPPLMPDESAQRVSAILLGHGGSSHPRPWPRGVPFPSPQHHPPSRRIDVPTDVLDGRAIRPGLEAYRRALWPRMSRAETPGAPTAAHRRMDTRYTDGRLTLAARPLGRRTDNLGEQGTSHIVGIVALAPVVQVSGAQMLPSTAEGAPRSPLLCF